MNTCKSCKYFNNCGDTDRTEPCKGYEYNSAYAMAIYGDGQYEYDGYFLVVLDEFDEHDNPTGKRKSLYVKADSKHTVREFIIHITRTGDVESFRNNEKLHIRQVWEVVTKNSSKL